MCHSKRIGVLICSWLGTASRSRDAEEKTQGCAYSALRCAQLGLFFYELFAVGGLVGRDYFVG